METYSRKGIFLDALVDGEACNLEPVTREEIMLKRLVECGGGSSGGLDLAELEKNPLSGKYVEGMGWSEGVGENIFNGAEPAYDSSDASFCFGSPRININKSYDITIRGDVYKNVAPVKIHPYYWLVCWGVESYDDMTADAEYPFQITAGWLDCTDNDGNPIWDSNGDFVCKPGNVDNWAYPNICVNSDKYPDLKPEDVKITECEIIHPIDPKLLPSLVVNITHKTYEGDDDNSYPTDVFWDGTFGEVVSAVKSGLPVTILDHLADNYVSVCTLDGFNDTFMVIYGGGTYYVNSADNSISLV